MFAPACKKAVYSWGLHCTSQPLCNESQRESWEQFAKSSAAKTPLLAMLLEWGDLQQSTNSSSVMRISPHLLPYNLEELQEDTSVSPCLWMGIALVKMGGKPHVGLYKYPSTLSFAIRGTVHWREILVRSKGEKAGDICFMFSLKITIKPGAIKLHREINSFMKYE